MMEGCAAKSRLDRVVNEFKLLSSEEKIAAFDGIINVCEPTELKYLSDHLEIFLKRDFVRFLPNELCLYLLSWLDPVSLGRCCLVSKAWNEAVLACSPVWSQACKSIGWKVDDSISSGMYWKNAFIRARTRIKQLKSGSAFEESFLIGHAARVYTVKFNENDLLASGSDDHAVRLWDIATGECLQTVRTHTCADLAFDTYFLYTASFDNTISCWKWDTGDMVRNYRGHTGAVFSIAYHEGLDLLISGSADKTVRLWQLSSGEQINMYHGHREWVIKVLLQKSDVESLHHKPGDFVILSMDKTMIKIWLISREVNCECLCELSPLDYVKQSRITGMIPSYLGKSQQDQSSIDSEHCLLYPQLLFDGSRIMCSSDRGILEWDFKDYTLTRITPHANRPSYLLGAGNMMLLAADTCENCLYIRMHGSALESQQSTKYLKSQSSASTNHSISCLSQSPETVDYEQDPSNEPSTSSGFPSRPGVLPRFSSQPMRSLSGSSITPTDDSLDIEYRQDDELMSDINFNNIKTKSSNCQSNQFTNTCPGVLSRWKLPLCRWSKRGSSYVCGDQSWLNGFSDVNNSGLVFAAALHDHSIYILRWTDCT